ncbi:MAG: endoribonuclease MazF [Candidatus Omnitrophica bacterium]|nr:endoribonuclease MazF [Candidatus Omnitrophota bacterium]
MHSYLPDRGHVVWLNFSPQSGHEQAGKRPAVVVSSIEYNKRSGLALFCPITNQIKGYPFEVLIPDRQNIRGAVLADQVKSFDWRAREVKVVEKMSTHITEVVINKISLLLEIKK